jgi:DNA-binding helix-hairpin-helix protein with protein kinase domain
MVQNADPELLKFAAWPTTTLHDAPGGLLVGFAMPRFSNYRAIHTLYSPAHRRTTFPHADWAFLIHTAMNCAIAFDTIHARGHVIGDVNQSNVLVSDQALVCLIDCDSFQVRAGDRHFLCEVGVGPYTPSELQGQNFRNVVRTPNHDRFGLAVLVFHLLFMGRHPFAGRYLGTGEMPLEQAIQQFRFVYARNATELQMAPPPNALPLSVLSPELVQFFERAFGRGAELDNARPSAAEWQTALADFQKQLRTCPEDPGHKVPAHLLECPWCAISNTGGPNFFLGVAVGAGSFAIDTAFLARLWERIERVPFRKKTYAPPTRAAGPRPAPTPLARRGVWLRGLSYSLGRLALIAFFVQFILLCFSWRSWLVCLVIWGILVVAQQLLRSLPTFAEETRRRRALGEARAELKAVAEEWKQLARRYNTELPKLKKKLQEQRDEYLKLQAHYDAERPQQQQNKEAYFRDQFLRTCFISDHEIEKIGPGRKAMLASYGIETAFDLDRERVSAIRGMGPVLTGNLLAWKKKMQAQFQYDPQAVVPETHVRSVVLKYQQREESLRRQLTQGTTELEALSSQTEEQLRPLWQRLEALTAQAAQAAADVKAFAAVLREWTISEGD